MKYDVITVGSGLGGLLSSLILAKEGKKVLLLESHSSPGGYCTSYKRQGFIVSIPSVINDISKGKMYTFLKDIGYYDEIEWYKINDFAKCIFPGMEIVIPSGQPDIYRSNLINAFPEEQKAIDRFISDLKNIIRLFQVKFNEQRGIKDIGLLFNGIKMILPKFKISFSDYLERITENPYLKRVLAALYGYNGLPPQYSSALNFLFLIAVVLSQPMLYPKNGFQSIANFFETKFLECGGEIQYKQNVTGFDIKENIIRSVLTDRGHCFKAKVILSNSDTLKTFEKLVGNCNLNSKYLKQKVGHSPSASCISIHLGTALDLAKSDLNYGQIFVSESWEEESIIYDGMLTGKEIPEFINYGLQVPSLFSRSLAPKNKHLVHLVIYPASKHLFRVIDEKKYHTPEYEQRKKELEMYIINKAEKIIPGLSKSIVMTDVATPYTFERYTQATNGAIYNRVDVFGSKNRICSSKTPVKNLYMTGTKSQRGGGLPTALSGGWKTTQLLLGTTIGGIPRKLIRFPQILKKITQNILLGRIYCGKR